MIKIEHPYIEKIAKDYYQKIRKPIKERCEFLISVFDLFDNNSNIDVIRNNSLNTNTKKSLINLLLATPIKNIYQIQSKPNFNQRIDKNQFSNFCKHLNNDNNLEKLILCKPDNAIEIENQIKNLFTSPENDLVKNFIMGVLNYSLFNNLAYDIAKNLNINTCPYCNRNYINTVIDKKGNKIIRPTFDHFFPQSKHPFLALSFYNLIPACYYCNSSTKKDAHVSIETHIHPYKEGFDNDANFNFLLKKLEENKSDPTNYTLNFKDNMIPSSPSDRYRKIFGGTREYNMRNEGNINLFRLNDIYQSHLDIVGELVVKCDMLNSSYVASLNSLLLSLGTTRDEFYLFYFGNYFNEKNFNRRPMAKLTKDIVTQIIPHFVK